MDIGYGARLPAVLPEAPREMTNGKYDGIGKTLSLRGRVPRKGASDGASAADG